jgi:DNA polymerase-3 subunit alpha/error-prone DNA polymerase
VLCLVRDRYGYGNLCNLITRRKTDREFSLLRDIERHHGGLAVLSTSLHILQRLKNSEIDIVANLGSRATEHGGTLRKWALAHDVPAVATMAAHMATAQEEELFALMQAIRTNSRLEIKAVKNKEDDRVSWIEKPVVLRQRFAVWPEVLAAAELLAERCAFQGPDFGLVMPPWNGGKGNAAKALQQAAYDGACLRYGDDLSEAVVERLEYELEIIETMGFSSYFLVVRDIVHGNSGGKEQKRPRICGRGSGAASLVAYCLEITNICPLKHNLYFERFLNPGRSDAPDIDIDFAWDERDAVLAQVLRKYKNHAAMVATIIRFQPRMAIRETAKAFGLASGEISDFTKVQNRAEPWPQIVHLAAQLVNIPRHISVHPGGVIITPQPLCNYVPVELAAKGVPIIQWDKDGAEEAGLVKIDLLGNRSLGVIRDCIASIRTGKRSFDEEYWLPEEDLKTKENVAAGKTMGCFYIESPAMRLLQQKAASGDFEQLVLQSSIIRPAANEFVREYVRRLRGGKWQHLHPKLANVLDETFGLMVYQEDVSRVAVAVAGFSHAEADGLRKVMSKKDKVLRLRDYKVRFDAGCEAGGIDAGTRTSLWQMMMSFDGYSFCKAHSASYARVSYQAAYLKSHYPAEFMAAVISNQGGYYSTFAYVSEAKRLGLEILPPCVNASSTRWQGAKSTIRVGLLSIAKLSAETMEQIVSARENAPYRSSLDFWQRVSLQQDESRALIQAGALDAVSGHRNRSRLFWELAQFQCLGRVQKMSSLFAVTLPPSPDLASVSQLELFRREYQVLGFLCRQHPLLLHGEAEQGCVKAKDMKKQSGKRVLFAGWLISGKIVSTKTGEAMEFLTFEDETALLETVFFPKVYSRYATVLSAGCAYLLWGMVEEEFGAVTLTVEKLRKI